MRSFPANPPIRAELYDELIYAKRQRDFAETREALYVSDPNGSLSATILIL